MTSQLMALAETYRFVEGAHILGTSDMAKTVEGLCRHLPETYGIAIEVDATAPTIVHADHATALSVIVNERVTNAITHGGSPVKVTLNEARGSMWISAASARGQLPGDLQIEETNGFGLRAVRTKLSSLGGRITARNLPGNGTAFQREIPSSALRRVYGCPARWVGFGSRISSTWGFY